MCFSQSTPFPQLPFELVLSIVDFVNPDQLLSIMLTSKALKPLAERRLYRHIDLSNSPTRSTMLFQSIIARPELAKPIVSFKTASKDLIAKTGDSDKTYVQRKDAYKTLSEAATRHLVNVQDLCAQGPSTELIPHLSQVKSITKFRAMQYCGKELPAHGGMLFDHLPAVTHLELPVESRLMNLANIRPNHCPLLQELICPANVAMHLVPGRPVEKLFISLPLCPTQGARSPYTIMAALAQTSASIKTLGMVVPAPWDRDLPQLLRATAYFLPDVEELYLTFQFAETDSQALEFIMETLPQDLKSFRRLRVFDFNGSKSTGINYFTETQNEDTRAYVDVLNVWSSSCPTLRKVVFPNGQQWTKTSSSWSGQDGVRLQYDAKLSGRIRSVGIVPLDEPMFEKDL